MSFGFTIFVQVSPGSLELITLIRKTNLKGQERIGSNSIEVLSPVAGEHPSIRIEFQIETVSVS